MRKATILIFAGIAVAIGLLFFLTDKDDFEPYEKILARRINSSTLHAIRDKSFNTEIKVPGMFAIEEDTSGIAYTYARYAYYPEASRIDAKGQIIIEYCATVNMDTCGGKYRLDSVIHSNGYVTYAKSVREQKMKFTYSLTYPSAYEACVARLKKEVREWGAFVPDRSRLRPAVRSRRQRVKAYHSGFAAG